MPAHWPIGCSAAAFAPVLVKNADWCEVLLGRKVTICGTFCGGCTPTGQQDNSGIIIRMITANQKNDQGVYDMTIRPLLLALPLMLTGCSTMANMHMPQMSWSSLNPINWFGSSLEVTDEGVGKVTASTPLNETAVNDGLNGDYRLMSGMSMSNGKMRSFYQAMDGKTVKLTVSGEPKGNVDRIVVSDPDVKSQWGVKIGTPFSDLYTKAFDACQKGQGDDAQNVECKAPNSQHVSYIFSGAWDGPNELMPSDDSLKNWKVSKIVWHAANN
jgi:hypothetical protein